jgi:hypothetical protein
MSDKTIRRTAHNADRQGAPHIARKFELAVVSSIQ